MSEEHTDKTRELGKAVEMLDKFDGLLGKEIAKNAELLQKVQQLEKYSQGTLCTECIYHTAWENENWDIVHWCKAHARQVTEDDFCSMGELPDLPEEKECH